MDGIWGNPVKLKGFDREVYFDVGNIICFFKYSGRCNEFSHHCVHENGFGKV